MENEVAFVSVMPMDWWAFCRDKFMPLGICEGFDEADDIAESKYRDNSWIIDRASLQDLRTDINVELSKASVTHPGQPANFWAFHDGTMKFVGAFAEYEDAEEKGDLMFPGNIAIMSQDSLSALLKQIAHELDSETPTSPSANA